MAKAHTATATARTSDTEASAKPDAIAVADKSDALWKAKVCTANATTVATARPSIAKARTVTATGTTVAIADREGSSTRAKTDASTAAGSNSALTDTKARDAIAEARIIAEACTTDTVTASDNLWTDLDAVLKANNNPNTPTA